MDDSTRPLVARLEASLGPLLPQLLAADSASTKTCAAAEDLCSPGALDMLLSMAAGRSLVFDRIKVFLAEPAACRAPKDVLTQVLALITAVTNQQLRALLASLEAMPSNPDGKKGPKADFSILDSLKGLSKLFGLASFRGSQVKSPSHDTLSVTEAPATGLSLLLLRCEALKQRLLLAAGIDRRLSGPPLSEFSTFCSFLPSRLLSCIRPQPNAPECPSNHPLGPRTFAPVLLELDSLLERCCKGLALPRCCEVGRNAGLAPKDRLLEAEPFAVHGVRTEESLRNRLVLLVTESVTLVSPFLLLTAARQGSTPPFLASPLGTAAIFESLEHQLRSLQLRDDTSNVVRRYKNDYRWLPTKVDILTAAGTCFSGAAVDRALRLTAGENATEVPSSSATTAMAAQLIVDQLPWADVKGCFPTRRLLGLDHRSTARATGLLIESQLLCSLYMADCATKAIGNNFFGLMPAAALFLSSASSSAFSALCFGAVPPGLLVQHFYSGLRRSGTPLVASILESASLGLGLEGMKQDFFEGEELRWLAEGLMAWLDPKLRLDIVRLAVDSDILYRLGRDAGPLGISGDLPRVDSLNLRRRVVMMGMRGQIPGRSAERFCPLGLWASYFGPREARAQHFMWRRKDAALGYFVEALTVLSSHGTRKALSDMTVLLKTLAHASEALDDIRRLPAPEERCWRLFDVDLYHMERVGQSILNLKRVAKDLPPTHSSLLPLCAYVASLGQAILLALKSPQAEAAAGERARRLAGVRDEGGSGAAGSAGVQVAIWIPWSVAVFTNLCEWRRLLRQVSRHLREVVLAAAEAMEDARAVGGGAAALGHAILVMGKAGGTATVSAAGGGGAFVSGAAAYRTREVDERNRAEVEGALGHVRLTHMGIRKGGR